MPASLKPLADRVVIDRIPPQETTAGRGFNAATLQYGDMMSFGVIDPTKVVRPALQDAASVSSLMLTTEAVVVEIPERKPPVPGGAGAEAMNEDF